MSFCPRRRVRICQCFAGRVGGGVLAGQFLHCYYCCYCCCCCCYDCWGEVGSIDIGWMLDDSETNDVKIDELMMMILLCWLVWRLSRLAVCMEEVSVDMMSRFAVASCCQYFNCYQFAADWVHGSWFMFHVWRLKIVWTCVWLRKKIETKTACRKISQDTLFSNPRIPWCENLRQALFTRRFILSERVPHPVK